MIPVLKKILDILSANERKKCYTLACLQLLVSLLDITALALLVAVIDLYTHPAPTLKWAGWIPGSHTPGSLLPAGFLLFFFALKNLLAQKLNENQYHFVYAVAADLSRKKMLACLNGSFTAHAAVDSAVWIKKISQRPIEFAHYLLAGLQQLFTESCLLLLAVTAILLYNALLFFWLLILFLPALLLLSYYLKRKISLARKEVKSSGETSLQYLKETLDGYVESNIYAKNIFFTERYRQQQQKLNRQLADLQGVQTAPSRLMELFAVAGLFVLLLLQLPAGKEKWIDLTSLTAFVGFAYKCIPGIVKLFNISAQIRTYAFTLDELQPETKTENNGTKSILPAPIDKIEIKNLHFSYPGKPIFTALHGNINKKELTGIRANSGRGKSTLINLLLGFLEPDSGSIEINGIPLSMQERRQCWPSVAYIRQQHFILHDTLLANITLSNDPYNQENLQDAITMAGLSGFINEHPEGLNYLLHEQGRNISGGQRQRVALARAFYKKADILVADEPFNELDQLSVSYLMQTFRQLADAGKMILLITHNSYALSQCNQVISIDD